MYLLIHKNEQGIPTVLRRYQRLHGARIGMRISNRNAGWARISRAANGLTEMEWCAKTNGLPIYDYGPYVVMNEQSFAARYNSSTK